MHALAKEFAALLTLLLATAWWIRHAIAHILVLTPAILAGPSHLLTAIFSLNKPRRSLPTWIFVSGAFLVTHFLFWFRWSLCVSSWQTHELQAQALIDMTAAFGNAADSAGVRWWADYGTLLGAVRDGGILAWDVDVDLCMYYDDVEKASQFVVPQMEAAGFSLAPHVAGWESGWRFYTWKHKYFLDIFFFEQQPRNPMWKFYAPDEVVAKESASEKWVGRHHTSRFDLSVPERFVVERDVIPWEGKTIAIPNHVDEFLVWRFGTDWRIPHIKEYGSQSTSAAFNLAGTRSLGAAYCRLGEIGLWILPVPITWVLLFLLRKLKVVAGPIWGKKNQNCTELLNERLDNL